MSWTHVRGALTARVGGDEPLAADCAHTGETIWRASRGEHRSPYRQWRRCAKRAGVPGLSSASAPYLPKRDLHNQTIPPPRHNAIDLDQSSTYVRATTSGTGALMPGGCRCSASQDTTASMVIDFLVLRVTSAARPACRRPAAPASALQVTPPRRTALG